MHEGARTAFSPNLHILTPTATTIGTMASATCHAQMNGILRLAARPAHSPDPYVSEAHHLSISSLPTSLRCGQLWRRQNGGGVHRHALAPLPFKVASRVATPHAARGQQHEVTSHDAITVAPTLSACVTLAGNAARSVVASLAAAAAANPLVGIIIAALLCVAVAVGGLTAAASLGWLGRRPAFSYLMQSKQRFEQDKEEQAQPVETEQFW